MSKEISGLLHEKRIMKGVFRLAPFLFVVAALQTGPAIARMPIESQGMATIGADIYGARELAMLRAKAQALETLGVGIKTETLAARGKLLDEYAVIQTSGFVERCEIVDEWMEKGCYHVRLKVWVKNDDSLAIAHRALFQGRSADVSGEGPGAEHIEREIKKLLSSSFYLVLSGEHALSPPDVRILISTSLNEGGGYGKIRSFYASVSIRVTRGAATSEALVVSTERPQVIYGLTANQALNGGSVNQFYDKVARPLVFSFWNRFLELEKDRSRPVAIEISGLPNLQAFRSFRDYVRDIRLGMCGMIEEEYRDGWGRLKVKYRERSLYLATILGYSPRYRVAEYGNDRIKVTYHGGEQ